MKPSSSPSSTAASDARPSAGHRERELVVVPDAAHLANVEAPAQVTAALLDHLVAADPEVRHGR